MKLIKALSPCKVATVLLGTLSLAHTAALTQVGLVDCLNVVEVGQSRARLVACGDTDPAHLANDSQVQRAMASLGISPSSVTFKGCEGAAFATIPDVLGTRTSAHYTITYPVASGTNYFAPIAHELAHILQIEAAGTLQKLRKAYVSKKIELGADFLAGLVLAEVLTRRGVNQFQANPEIYGLYRELDTNAHGTPAERTAAFRFGVYLDPSKIGSSMRLANEYFYADIYQDVLKQQ